MGLRDKIKPDPSLCIFGRIRQGLPEDERQALDTLQTQMGAPRLSSVLRHEGHQISETSTARHLAKVCKCFD